MPYFSSDFSTPELELMRRAAADCARTLGVAGDVEKERDIALAILRAASAGERSLDQLIAAGVAAIKSNGP
ncbi:hypothetical protein [Phreatobacter cathodiphilus]|uniref:hypothetical protein n=1 Tax=Phreatobacter cathodiphilus TaxID=1868589 RepID=UPI0015E644C0|nr:hypothetical protein [Phreatobacter cathodiphilus]